MESAPKVRLSGVSMTDKGCIRDNNEDAVFCGDGLFLVADGMGGHACGEVASQLVIETVVGQYAEHGRLRDAIQAAHINVREASQANLDKRGMGSTVVALCENEKGIEVAWVGDSRAYAWDESAQSLKQITRDHSLVGQLVADGLLTVDQARTHPHRHVITQCLGSVTKDTVEVDYCIQPWQPGMAVLLCSDGLSDEVTERQIRAILSQPLTPELKVEMLVNEAKNNGGKDNISAVLVY